MAPFVDNNKKTGGISVFEFISLALAVLAGLLVVKSISSNRDRALRNLAEGDRFLEQNGAREAVQTFPSGLQYEVLEAGSGTEHPGPTDKVAVHYRGTFIDGEEFDSSIDHKEPIRFALNQVIHGWTEGLQLMVEGEKARFVLHSDLAYGKRGAGNIPPGSTLIFEVELLSIDN